VRNEVSGVLGELNRSPNLQIGEGLARGVPMVRGGRPHFRRRRIGGVCYRDCTNLLKVVRARMIGLIGFNESI
jgi:hypothetical protein